MEFSQVEKIEWHDQYSESFHANVPFLYETAFHHGYGCTETLGNT